MPGSAEPITSETTPQAWQKQAACAGGEHVNLFFGPEGETTAEKSDREDKAKLICGRCAVRSACLEYAMEEGVIYGVWGGMGESDRESLKRQRARQRNIK